MVEPSPSMVVPQRSVPCRLLTPGGWLQGNLRMPRDAALAGYLNRLEAYFRLTDVQLPLRQNVHDFFAIARDSVLAVIPLETSDREDLVRTAGSVEHATSWLLPGGAVLDGMLDLVPGERISDHLMKRTGFVRLRECTFVFPHGGPVQPGQFAYPAVALQPNRAIGVTELAGPGA